MSSKEGNADYAIDRSLSTIAILNGFSLIGLLIPIIGVIFSSIAISKSSAILNHINNDQESRYYGRAWNSKSFAQVMIVIYIVIIIIWAFVLFNQHA